LKKGKKKLSFRLPTLTITLDEAIAIYLYTVQWSVTDKESSLYFKLNKALRQEKRDEITMYFPYMEKLLSGWGKLPSIGENKIVYRIVDRDLSADYKVGNSIDWWSFSSCSKDFNQCLQFANPVSPDSKITKFIIQTSHGKSIEEFSRYPIEEEVLLVPSKMVVKEVKVYNQFVEIHLLDEGKSLV